MKFFIELKKSVCLFFRSYGPYRIFQNRNSFYIHFLVQVVKDPPAITLVGYITEYSLTSYGGIITVRVTYVCIGFRSIH